MGDVKQTREEENDELRPEFDLKSLRVRKLGPDRKRFGKMSIETREDKEYCSRRKLRGHIG
jgi:hypothetical protein